MQRCGREKEGGQGYFRLARGGGLKTKVMSAVNKREPINGISLHHSLKLPAHIGKI